MDIVKAFENYRRIIAMIDHDLSFWESFLSHSIKEYQKQKGMSEEIYGSVFAVWDVNPATNDWVLTTHNETKSTMTVDLERHRLSFYAWIENLILLKIYNASEIFLLQAIWLKYFPTLSNPTASSKASNELQKKIRKELNGSQLMADTKNNRHLMEFLKLKSDDFKKFVALPLSDDLNTTRGDFFEMMSVLRNIVAHQGTTMKKGKKKSFERHFIRENT